MAEEKIIVAYKVEIVVSREGGFGEKEANDIRKVAEEQMVEVKKNIWRYLRDNLTFLQLELFADSGWSKEEIKKIRVENIRVE